MTKVCLFLLVFAMLEVHITVGQSCSPGPPVSRFDGTIAGTPIPGGGLQLSFEHALLTGFSCFKVLNQWFPAYVSSPSATNADHVLVDMAYATYGTATFFNVVVPSTGNYTVSVRYAYDSGLFPGIIDRPEGIMVNDIVVSYGMHFPINHSWDNFAEANIVVPLKAGKNTIEMFNITNHGVGRLDTMTITPVGANACSPPPTAPAGLVAMGISGSVIGLNWKASTAPADCAVSQYNVFRSTTSGFVPSSNNQIASGGTSLSSFDSTALCDTNYYYLIEAVSAGGPSEPSNQLGVPTGACPLRASVQINTGGQQAVGSFAADEGFVGGNVVDYGSTIDLTGVVNPAPMSVYQSARTGNFFYILSDFIPGSSHTVRLHFAETEAWGPGARTFDVSINGTRVLTNFDIFAAAGGRNKAIIQQFAEKASSSGDYVLTFTPKIGDAFVGGIEVE